jgi:large subunit ribosomal protein L19e
MTDLKNQKRLAAALLKCGEHRVRFDDRRLEDIAEAVTRSDIRKLIVSGAIFSLQKKGVSRGRKRFHDFQKAKGRRKGHGTRRGGKRSRAPKKRRWIMVIRPIRNRLKLLREKGIIDKATYRLFYRQAKGNMFKNKAHLNQHLEMKGIKLKDEKVVKEKKVTPKKTKGAGPKEKKERREKKKVSKVPVKAPEKTKKEISKAPVKAPETKKEV